MRTKIIKQKSIQKLVVDDESINSKSQYGSPIVLAAITNFFESSCWSFDDYRLKQNLIPSTYLGDTNQQIYNFKDYPEEDKKLVLSKLHTYNISEDEGLFYWRFDGVDLNGDIPVNDERHFDSLKNEYPKCACFTFKAAQKKLKEAKEFWDSYEGSLTDESIKLPNEHRQPHTAEFYFDLSFNKEKLEKAKKNKDC